jgi:hypothetical protein
MIFPSAIVEPNVEENEGADPDPDSPPWVAVNT